MRYEYHQVEDIGSLCVGRGRGTAPASHLGGVRLLCGSHAPRDDLAWTKDSEIVDKVRL